MSTRISDTRFLSFSGKGAFAAILVLQLAACGSAPSEQPAGPAGQAANQATPPQGAPRIPCAPPGVAELSATCTVERVQTREGVVLTLRHADGAFHRLQITADGRGVIAADGAEPAKVTPVGPDRIDVEVGGARYRLPATVRR